MKTEYRNGSGIYETPEKRGKSERAWVLNVVKELRHKKSIKALRVKILKASL